MYLYEVADRLNIFQARSNGSTTAASSAMGSGLGEESKDGRGSMMESPDKEEGSESDRAGAVATINS